MEEIFKQFTEQTGIQIPQNIKEHYLNSKNDNSEFVRLFKSNFDSSEKCNRYDLKVLISEKFAAEILKLIFTNPKKKMYSLLFHELEMFDNFYKGKQMATSLDSEKLLIEEIFYHVIHYDYKNNEFKFPLIQKAYENLNSNSELIKVILILFGSCGGEGGIIVRGKNLGFDVSYTHNEISEIEFNDETFEYWGYSLVGYEKNHLVIETRNR